MGFKITRGSLHCGKNLTYPGVVHVCDASSGKRTSCHRFHGQETATCHNPSWVSDEYFCTFPFVRVFSCFSLLTAMKSH